MTVSAIQRAGGKRRRRLLLKPILAVALLALVLAPSAQSVHDLGLFELDRNAVDNPAVPGDDWSTLYGGGGSALEFTGILEDASLPGTQFQGGGSKDDLDITEWLWKPGEPLDKDDITNAYAAAYTNTVDTGENNIGDLIIYFGLDRFSANGSAQVGFWFLQDPNIGLTNTPSGGGFKFSGAHVDNDVLVQSNFTNGGTIERLSVFKWQGGGLVPLIAIGADCLDSPALADDRACAVVNRQPTPAPWPYTPKANEGLPGTFLTGAFFEGGLNISRLIPDAGCFTAFLAETRSSTPFDARLKDFAAGNFDLCQVEVEKSGDELGKVGDAADYAVTITNSGGLTLYKDDISDSLLGSITVNGVDQANPLVVSNGCGASLAPGASCTITLRRTVLAGDPDPLPNTVSITYKGKADLSGTAVSDTDSHSVNLFQPSLTVTKTGDALSKVGDDVNYNIRVCNTSSADSPDLVKDSVSDSLIGGVNAAFGASLAPGACEDHNFTRTVLAGDPDPLVNTATAHYHPAGFPNDINGSDSHSVNLFQPNFTIEKTADALSKVGDPVTFRITVTNTSSNDSPNLSCRITDALLGIDKTVTLAPGASDVTEVSRPTQAGDPDPLVNTASATCTVAGFPNVLGPKSASSSTNLFQPSLTVTKTGDALSKVGDDVNYNIRVCNTSSADSPDLVKDSVSDSLIGGVNAAFGASLAPGACEDHNFTRTVLAGDPDPLVNTATAHYHPAGFPNDINGSDSHSVNLFQPSVAINKTGDALSKVGDPVDYRIVVTNTSSADSPNLNCTVSDPLLGISKSINLAPGATDTTDATRTVQPGDPDPLVNTASAACTVGGGFGNVLATVSDSHSVNLFQPSVEVDQDRARHREGRRDNHLQLHDQQHELG